MAITQRFATENHVATELNNITLDKTLSIEDVPADAKAVGDALDELEEQIPETWELLADITLEEETNTIDQRWFGTPMRKIMVNVSSLAASSNTNYMPTTIYTREADNAYAFNTGRFYPEALPRTTAVDRTYIAEVFMLGENAVMKFTEYQCGITPAATNILGTEAVKTAATYGNSGYADPLYEQITGIQIHTYSSFAAGTRFTFWGVAK